ncbi:5'-3' exonuclease [Aeromicrobium wangtongii]|uniref:5'-3' exonuclease n=1 Tax=Aeromicrobium wangtongii TaxID=2969247 RepID=A0ABY5M2M0_9ACTN|nr:5'-3' exonuclease [Aeromicrobium wangtongii]MCD9198057.1 5'-3' exonuclease [Aeromicrobium wangtongii]MCL3819226.1 5'-3' exonuclease [Aeromicrobium wangtongii]UUP12097.1 5'-3' exonuclease [Aeromicrobium wangtongii]
MSHGRLLLLDSASLYFRAFFGIPKTLKAPDGTVVNALRGILDFTSTLTTQYSPEAVVACWDDDWRPQWRVDLLDTYKTQRLDDEGGEADTTEGLLGPQVPLIAEAFDLLGIPVVGAADFEADDVIGTLAEAWDGPVDIVTGDRDLFQLVDDDRGIRVLYVARGVSKHDVVDNAWLRDKYGVDASSYVDFAVMRGDASDGLPGVAGIGDKTAAALLAEFGDLDGILAAAKAIDIRSSIKPRVRASLLDSVDYITAAREVVAVRRDVCELPDLSGAADAEAFTAFGQRWGLGGVTERALTARSRWA